MDNSEVATADQELTLTRVVRMHPTGSLVFRMWTDPKHVAQWWGPAGFTNPVCEMDVRPGGKLRIVMRAPDGTEYPMTGTFREVVAPERLVFTQYEAVDEDGNALIDGFTTLTLIEEGAKTKLTVQTRAVALVPLATRMLEGWNPGGVKSLDRLEEHVGRASGGSEDRALEISRIIDAPREHWCSRPGRIPSMCPRPLVGSPGFYDDVPRNGYSSGRRLSGLHALGHRHAALPTGCLSRNRAAGTDRLHLCLGRTRQAIPASNPWSR